MFRVSWLYSPANELSAWVEEYPHLRDAIVAAVREAGERLEHDPLNEGESREVGFRGTFIDPLFITFMIDTDERIVRVVHIHLYRSQP